MSSKNQRRKRGNDMAAELRSRAMSTPTAFWAAARTRYPDEIAEIADTARDHMTLRDLQAMEAAELVEIEAQIDTVESHKSRAILRNAARQGRRNLALLVLASHPTLDPTRQMIELPEGVMIDYGLPAAEVAAREAERRAAVEAEKVRILDAIISGKAEPDNYLRRLHTYQRDDLQRMRTDALRARLRAEDEARAAWARLEAERLAGKVIYDADPRVAIFGDAGRVDDMASELRDEIAAELRDDPDEDEADPFGDL